MITGAAVVAGIAGWPVAHSLSPVIHNAWLAAAGMDGVYAPLPTRDEASFRALIEAGRAGAVQGLNVTAPFKELAFALADTTSDRARRVGSANILVFETGRVLADSSDGEGLMRALADQAAGLDVAGRTAVILGAGGAARAGAGALADAGAKVQLVNRTWDRAERLAADLGGGVGAAGPEVLGEAALVINALSVPPEIDVSVLRDDAVVMDMTYRPIETDFLKAARARGLATVDGLGMLIGQADASFEALYRRPPPSLDLRALLTAHLEGTGA